MQNIYKMKEHTIAVFDIILFPLVIASIFSIIYYGSSIFLLLDPNSTQSFFTFGFNYNLIMAIINIVLTIFLIVLRIKMIKGKNRLFKSFNIRVIVISSILVANNLLNIILAKTIWMVPSDLFATNELILGIFIIFLSTTLLIVFSISMERNWINIKLPVQPQLENFNKELIQPQLENFNKELVQPQLENFIKNFLIIFLSFIIISEMMLLGQITNLTNAFGTNAIPNSNVKTVIILSIVFDLLSTILVVYLTYYFISISKGRSTFSKTFTISIISILQGILVLNFIVMFIFIIVFFNYISYIGVQNASTRNFDLFLSLIPFVQFGGSIFFGFVSIVYRVKISNNTSSFWAIPKNKLPNEIAEIKNKWGLASFINTNLQNNEIIPLNELTNNLMLPYNFLAKNLLRWISDEIIIAKIIRNDKNQENLILKKKEQLQLQWKTRKEWQQARNLQIEFIPKLLISRIKQASNMFEPGKFNEAITELEKIKSEAKSYDIPEIIEIADEYIKQAQILKKILDMFKISSKLTINDICEQLERPRKEILNIFLDVGEKLGVNIEDDIVTINNTDDLDSMIFDLLKRSFEDWAGKEKTKVGKI